MPTPRNHGGSRNAEVTLVNSSGTGTAPIASASTGPNAGAGRARHRSTAANPKIASTYQASSGIPLGKNCGSGCDSQRSIVTQAESHAAPMTNVARCGLPEGVDLTGFNNH